MKILFVVVLVFFFAAENYSQIYISKESGPVYCAAALVSEKGEDYQVFGIGMGKNNDNIQVIRVFLHMIIKNIEIDTVTFVSELDADHSVESFEIDLFYKVGSINIERGKPECIKPGKYVEYDHVYISLNKREE